MKAKLCLFFLLILVLSQNVYSSGALRHILPFLSSLTGGLREGELAYDEVSKSLVFKNNSSIVTVDNGNYSEQDLPLITTSIRGNPSTFIPLVYSEISAGNIRVKGKVFKNSSSILCTYDETTPTTALGYFDGSTRPSTTPPFGLQHPMYLYLIQSGSGFNCILSFNSTGPETSFTINKSWVRVQSIVGGSVAGLGPVLKTIGRKTYVRDGGRGGLSLFLETGTNLSVDNEFLLTHSMSTVAVAGLTCGPSDDVSILEKIITPTFTKKKNKLELTRYVKIAGCNGFINPKGDVLEIIFSGTERKIYYTSNEYKNLDIYSWTEIPLSSN